MFNKLFLFLTLIMSILLPGCKFMDTEYNPQIFAEEKRALVIMRSYTRYESGKLDHLTTVWDYEKKIWDNKNTGYAFQSNESHSTYNSIVGMDNYFAHSILPGKYKLSDFKIRGVRMVKSFFGNATIPADPFTKYFYLKERSGEVEFEVKPNEVVYIGDFVFNYSKSVEIKDSFSGAARFVKAKYPELAPKLTKKLIKIPPSVKFYYFIGREKVEF